MTDEITLRRGRPDDAVALHGVFRRAVLQLTKDAYSKAEREAWARGEQMPDAFRNGLLDSEIWLLERTGKVLGFATVTEPRYVDLFFIDPDGAGQGLAGRLMRHVLDQLGPGPVGADVSLTARAFFEKHGFQVVREQSHPRDGVVLRNFKMVRN